MRRLAYGFIVVVASSLLVGLALHSSRPSAPQPDLAGVKKPTLDLSKVPRLVLTFYYAWYRPGRWGNVLDHPTLGFYNSSDREAIRRHFEFAEEAGIDGLTVSLTVVLTSSATSSMTWRTSSVESPHQLTMRPSMPASSANSKWRLITSLSDEL